MLAILFVYGVLMDDGMDEVLTDEAMMEDVYHD